MKLHNIGKLLLIILAMTLCLSLFVGCGDTPDPTPDDPDSGNNEPGNDTDDNNEPQQSPYLDLTKDGNVLFTLVYDSSDELIKAAADSLVAKFAAKGLTVKVAELSDASKITDCEIIVGSDFTGRTDYSYDTTTLGAEGYTYFVKNNKVVVTGGSSEFIAKALGILVSDVLRVESASIDANNINIERSLNVVKPQTYRITSISVGDTPLSEYNIIVTGQSQVRAAAAIFKNGVYQYTGINLDVFEEEKEHNIFFNLVENAGKDGYKVYVKDGDLYVDCAFIDSFGKGTENFVSALLVRSRGDVVLEKDYEFTTEVSKLYYADFGAVGDGVADDFEAIKEAHRVANLGGYTVVATEGATYNLGVHTESIIIQTNVIWTGARFIIDDSAVVANSSESKTNIFRVLPSMESFNITTLTSLSKGQTNIGLTFDGPMLVYLCDKQNDDRRVYIRYGGNANSGSLRQEIILVDKDGNVDPSTPILWDYPEIGSAVAYPAGEKPITIKGGTFTTIANQAPRLYTYYNRGIEVRRSNTTITKLNHYIQGEGETGAPYSGFLSTNHANNVTYDSILFTGHKVYKLQTDSSNSMGTYEIGGTNSNQLLWRNCTQTNDINNNAYWGVMGTNFCKNLTYDGCKLSRFDAHQGMHNTTIINSELGHQKINAIGSGLLRIENCTINGNNVVVLRTDYGSTWEGDVIIKDVHLKNTAGVTVFNASFINHFFGYTCYLPQNITIENLTTELDTVIYVFPELGNHSSISGDTLNGSPNLNPVVMPKTITVSKRNGRNFIVSPNANLFDYIEIDFQ